MKKEKINFIKSYIKRLYNKIEDCYTSAQNLLSKKENEWFALIIEINNVLNSEFPQIKDVILLRPETAIRDVNFIIGILKLALINVRRVSDCLFKWNQSNFDFLLI